MEWVLEYLVRSGPTKGNWTRSIYYTEYDTNLENCIELWNKVQEIVDSPPDHYRIRNLATAEEIPCSALL